MYYFETICNAEKGIFEGGTDLLTFVFGNGDGCD